jgi:FKBP-type peptidyl-prolyl cis-trans isomerase
MRLCLALILAAGVAACNSSSNPTTPTGQPPAGSIAFSATDLRAGTGTEATNGRAVTVNYTGWLYNTSGTENKGTLFDSSLAPGRGPLAFTVGANNIIPGFSQCALGMRVGGMRRCNIPPNLAYGSQGNSSIPPNATLIFELELLTVQ